MHEQDVELSDGRRLHAYDTAPGAGSDLLAAVWNHGTPNIGTPPEPLVRGGGSAGNPMGRL